MIKKRIFKMKRHLYHLVDRSPWPLFGSVVAFFLISGFVLTINKIENDFFIFIYNLLFIFLFYRMYYNYEIILYMKSYYEKKFYFQYYNSIYFIFGFFNRTFFGIFSKSKIKLQNSSLKKRFFSSYYKFEVNLKKKMINEIKIMESIGKINSMQRVTLINHIKKNFVHIKFGEIFEQDGEIVFIAYDVTTKGGEKIGDVYYKINGKKDEYISVFKNEKGIESFVNKIPVKRTFSNMNELNRNIRKVKKWELREKGINESGENEISTKLINIHKDKDPEFGLFDLNKYEFKTDIKLEFKEKEVEKQNKNDDIID